MDTINRFPPEGASAGYARFPKRKALVAVRRDGNMLYTSGHGPEDQITGKPIYAGRIGSDLTVQEGYLAARECGIILLGALRDYLGSLDRVKSIVKATALINVDNGFYDLDAVMDGFSDLMVSVLDERGYHTRTIMGTHNLPNGNIPVEIELIAEIW